MSTEAYYRQLFAPQYIVLGKTLPPLSLWHLAALEALASPFVTRQGSFDLADLQVAVKICLTRWPQQPVLRPTAVDLAQQRRRRGNQTYLAREARAFTDYLALHNRPPEIWESEMDKPRLLSAPAVLSRVAGMLKFPALTLDQIWNDISPGQALWLLCATAERETGEIRFVTDEDHEEAPPKEDREDEAATYAFAVQQLGQTRADAWWAARQRAAVNTVSSPS